MWKLSPVELHQLKGAGGERFTHFVDRLIRAEAARGGLPQSEIQTQLRVNIRDGGVDTQVSQRIPRDQSGWFAIPTCWQFKSVGADSIDDEEKKSKHNDLQAEIHKPYVEQLVKQGYGYRFCLLGDLSPSKVARWESQLKAEAERIVSGAPDPRVVHGGDLLEWTERFPAVIAWLRDLARGIFHLESWGKNYRRWTPHYVPNPEWQVIRQRVVQHADFNAPCIGGDPCMTIGGAAGVGKTRLALETLAELPASPGLVVYAADEQEAKNVATTVVNIPRQTAILVADECTPQTRYFLNENTRGHVERLRIICLDNTGERLASMTSQVWLSPDALKNTDEILAKNFPQVPADRRHQYATLSRGFVRLAADMCLHDDELRTGDLSGLLGSVERYVRHRLGTEHMSLISLLALFHKVGFREEVQQDLEPLCVLGRCSPQDFHDAVRSVRESPGFVVQAGRYWYVTPEIVSRVLFAEGWQRWVSQDPAAFLNQLPHHLQQHVIDRAAKLGGEEVRDQVAAFFRQWFGQLTARDLENPQATSLAEAIVEAAPEEYLPQLRFTIDKASPDELLHIQGHAPGATWGPRRTLVWLLERLVAFPEFFEDSEASLFRLALHETEPYIGNNATEIWRGLFSVYLSGTATPFMDRLGALKNRTTSSDLAAAKLGFRALARTMEETTSGEIGPPMVAGRLRPPDWQPATAEEELACYHAALELCEERLSGGSDHRRWAFEVITNSIGFLLARGLCEKLSEVLAPERLSEDEKRRLLNAVDHFIEIEEATGRASANDKAGQYMRQVCDWINTFRPSDFDGRLRSVCARDPWDRRFAEDPRTTTDESDELAFEILSRPACLDTHLDWLGSREAASAERLGFALGRRDKEFAVGQMVFEHAITRGAAPLLRGYVRGLVFSERDPSPELLELTDRLEASYPEVAVDILNYGGDRFDGMNRVLRLAESKRVSPKFLAGLAYGIGRRDLTCDDVARLLPCFVQAASLGDAESAQAGIRFLSTYIRFDNRRSGPSCFDTPSLTDIAWRLMENAVPHVRGQVTHEWSEIVKRLAKYNPGRAADLLGMALRSENLSFGSHVEEALADLAEEHSKETMRAFGEALLDEENGWRLQVGVLRDILARIPEDCVMTWVREHGIEAAQVIARHLPCPFVDEQGNAVVPALLDTILREYGDDQVFHSFLAGSHSRETWSGNASERFRREADNARKFLNHPNSRIREWAKNEVAHRLALADHEDREHAERFLPS